MIDQEALCELTGIKQFSEYQIAHRQWVEDAIQNNQHMQRETSYSETLAIGSEDYLSKLKEKMGITHHQRKIIKEGESYSIKEPELSYAISFDSKMLRLSPKNIHYWDDRLIKTAT